MRSLYKRQLIMMVGIMILSFTLLSAAFMLLSYRYIISEKRDSMERNAGYIAGFTALYYQEYRDIIQDDLYSSYVANIALISDSFVIVAGPDGEILYATDGAKIYEYQNAALPASITSQVLRYGNYAGLTNLEGIYPERRYTAGLPITVTLLGQTVNQGLVLVSADASNLSQMWSATATIFFFSAVVVLLISVVASTITSAHQARPLNEMAEAARKFGQGEFDVRVTSYEGRCDEISTLAEAFNAMANSLEKVETQRSEFIANISHELKTPITSILGFTELMTSGVVTDPIQKAQYLERIGEEGRRMSNLIDDILRLSSLESKQAEEVWERVDLRGLCEDIFRSLEPIMKKRGITGEIFGAAHYYAYPDDMRQLLKNLMENAVKYNRENGRVTVRISPDAYQCVISVVDTGIGIPLEHQSRVFERFYRVDKGRSKREGGTGLGLSIVKHITAKYAGQITLVSRPDEGTSIRVTLPVTEEGRR